MGVAVFCLLTLIALLPIGITANKNMVEQTVATGIMASVVDDLRNTPAPTALSDPIYASSVIPSQYYGIKIPRANQTPISYTFFVQDDGSLANSYNYYLKAANASSTTNPRYRVQVDFYPPGTSLTVTNPKGNGPTRVRILVTWPALADSGQTSKATDTTSSPKNFTGSVETVVSLNRNWLDH